MKKFIALISAIALIIFLAAVSAIIFLSFTVAGLVVAVASNGESIRPSELGGEPAVESMMIVSEIREPTDADKDGNLYNSGIFEEII